MVEKSKDVSSSALASYYISISKYPLLTKEEEDRLLKNYQTARGRSKNIIKEKLIVSNLRLVIKIAKNFQGCGLPLEDLINEGNLGLMRSIDRFSPKKGAKLSYYSSFWIKQSIYRALTNKSRLIRLPCGAFDDYTKINRLTNSYLEDIGREPTTDEISEELGLSKARIVIILNSVSSPKSLDQSVPSDSGSEKSYSEMIEDTKLVGVQEMVSSKEDAENLRKLLKKLPEREYDILVHRFGLGNSDRETLEKIGERHNVTRERIRQIETLALKKLKRMFKKMIRDDL